MTCLNLEKGSERMAGSIKKMLDIIIEQRSLGNPVIERLTRAKLAMKGFIYDKYTNFSEDDPIKISTLRDIAQELNVKL